MGGGVEGGGGGGRGEREGAVSGIPNINAKRWS